MRKVNELAVQGSANGKCGFSACTSSTYSTDPRTVLGVKGGYMERMDDGVTRRLQVDTACIGMIFESLERAVLDDDWTLEGVDEIELAMAEKSHRETTPENMLLELI